MSIPKHTSRRDFIRQSSLSLGAGVIGLSNPVQEAADRSSAGKTISQIRVASIDSKGLMEGTSSVRIKQMLQRMQEIAGMKPDVICLPEMFATPDPKEFQSLANIAEDPASPGPIAGSMAAFAKANNCYVVCPLITSKLGRFYNSSLLLDRQGAVAGIYHKMHPTKAEMLPGGRYANGGITPGSLDQPLLKADFGTVALRIGDDVNWAEGWKQLKSKGAQAVLLAASYCGGRMLNFHALRNDCFIVASGRADARVVDISGNDLDISSEFVRYSWATINLDKVNVVTWPTNSQLPRMLQKYGDRLGYKVWGNNDVITLESRDPSLKIKDVLKEFSIQTNEDLWKYETEVWERFRPAS